MKKICLTFTIFAIILTLIACVGKFKCDNCNQEKTGKKHKVEFIEEKLTICDDCYEQWKELKDDIKEFGL